MAENTATPVFARSDLRRLFHCTTFGEVMWKSCWGLTKRDSVVGEYQGMSQAVVVIFIVQ